MYKTLLAAAAGALCLGQLGARRFAIWAAVSSILFLSTLRHPDPATAHTHLASLSAALALALAGTGRWREADLVPAYRALAAALTLLGLDAALQSAGLPHPSGELRAWSGLPPAGNPFPLSADPARIRAVSFLGNPNRLGAYAAAAAPILLHAARVDAPARLWHRLAALLAAVAVAASYSRGATIALLAAAAIALPALRRIRGESAFVGALALGVLALAFSGAVFDLGEDRWRDRWLLWTGAWSAILARPIFGWGLGGFGPAFSLHAPAAWWRHSSYATPTLDAHQDLLELLVEFGAAGAVIAAALAAAFGPRLLRSLSSAPLLAAGAVSLVVSMLFSSLLKLPEFALLAVFLLLALRAAAPAAGRVFETLAAPSAWGWLALAALLPLLPLARSDALLREAAAARTFDEERRSNELLAAANRLRPRDPLPALLLGTGLEALAERYPGYGDAEWLLAERAARAGDATTAARWYERAARLRPGPARRLALARARAGVSMDRGEWGAAADDWEEAFALSGEPADAWMTAVSLRLGGESAIGDAALRTVLGVFPPDSVPPALRALTAPPPPAVLPPFPPPARVPVPGEIVDMSRPIGPGAGITALYAPIPLTRSHDLVYAWSDRPIEAFWSRSDPLEISWGARIRMAGRETACFFVSSSRTTLPARYGEVEIREIYRLRPRGRIFERPGAPARFTIVAVHEIERKEDLLRLFPDAAARDRAMEACRRALLFDPFDADARLTWARLLDADGNTARALREYTRLASLPRAAAHRRALADLDQRAEAEEIRARLRAAPRPVTYPIALGEGLRLLEARGRGGVLEIEFELPAGLDRVLVMAQDPMDPVDRIVPLSRDRPVVRVPIRSDRILVAGKRPGERGHRTNLEDAGYAPPEYPAGPWNDLVLVRTTAGWVPENPARAMRRE